MLLSEIQKRAVDEQVLQAYEECRDDVYYYGLTLGLGPAQAQDVAQEVFLKLYVQLREGEEIRSLRAWVFRVAHNEALKLRAKERTHAEISPETEPVAQTLSVEKRMVQDETRRRVQEAISDLSPQQQQVLQLRAAGLRYREIAETIGIGTSTVNEFMRRAVARLRKAIT
jgi:RNA polymerase sigma-70 factor (ECF subfamily)